LKEYKKYLKGIWIPIILAPVLMIIDALGSLVQPYFLSEIIDVGIVNNDTSYIIQCGIIMIIFALFGMFAGFGAMYFSSKASYGFAANLRKGVMSKIQDFSFANINKFTTSSLITRATNDIEVVSGIVQMLLRMAVRSPIMFIGGLIMALTMSKQLSIILIVLIPLILIFIVIIIKKSVPNFEKLQKKIDGVNKVIRENIIGIKVVKTFVREEQQAQRFDVANKELKDINIKTYNWLMVLMPIIVIILETTVAVVLWIGSTLIEGETMEIGQLSSFLLYIMMVIYSVIMLSMLFVNFSRATISSRRILEVLNEKVDIVNTDTADVNAKIQNGSIEYNVENFEFANVEGRSILKNIKFSVNAGDKIAIIGTIGSGKSTLVNLLPRFYDVTDGYVNIDGRNVKEYTIETLRESIGMVLQENKLFSGTIKDNIKWGKEDATDEEIIEACKISQIHDFIMEQPNQYDSIVEERGKNFSGGQKQRLCIARALIKKPKILILDDSVSALDGITEKKLMSHLKQYCSDVTLIVIAQRISSCKDANKILVMDDGQIKQIATHEELINVNGIYKEINESQQEVIIDE